jgi:hypothetical protein
MSTLQTKQMTSNGFGLGRLFAFDEKDFGYSALEQAPSRPNRRYKYHNASALWSYQNGYPHCVAHSWLHMIESGPITHPSPLGTAAFDTVEFYRKCQLIDEWPGENYDGTSVRAGAKIAQEMGLIESYWWGHDLESLINAVFLQPVVAGTDWFDGMSYPKGNGLIEVSGDLAGGHAYLYDGVNLDEEVFRIKNSWSRVWGVNGFAYIKFKDVEKLIETYGEFCLCVEKKIAA